VLSRVGIGTSVEETVDLVGTGKDGSGFSSKKDFEEIDVALEASEEVRLCAQTLEMTLVVDSKLSRR